MVEADLARATALARLVRSGYPAGDPGHDWSHVERVAHTALTLARALGADAEIVLAAGILHDLVNVPKDHPERLQASTAAATAAAAPLREIGFAPAQVRHVQAAIQEHSYSLAARPSSIESAILQDADRLDALGAIGVLRAATCGGRLGAAYYHSEDPFARDRPLDEGRFMIDHYYTKLLGLAARLNTDLARQWAGPRIAFMREFLHQLSQEIPERREGV